MLFYYDKIELDVPETVYYPREDSLLMGKAIEGLQLRGKNALEIGCGSGFLSILLAKRGARVTAVDINEEAMVTASVNAKANGAEVNIFLSDLFSKVEGAYDFIIFNPPYLPVEEGETDFTYAGGPSGRETIERFIAGVKKHLNRDGIVLLLISSLTGEKEVVKLFEENGMKTEIIAREKVPWEELVVIKVIRTDKPE